MEIVKTINGTTANINIVGANTSKKTAAKALANARVKNSFSMPVVFDKRAFAKNLAADVKHGFSRIFYALVELIDNAISAALKGADILPKRVYVTIIINDNGPSLVIVENTGIPVPREPMYRFGFGAENANRGIMNEHGTGTNQAFSALGGNASIATKHNDGIHVFDFSDWSNVMTEKVYSVNHWKDYKHTGDRYITTVVTAETLETEELKKITPEMFGAFYYMLLSSIQNKIELRFNGNPVKPYAVPGKLIRSATVAANTNFEFRLDPEKDPIKVEAYEYLMNDVPADNTVSDSDVCKPMRFFEKNMNWQGITIYANGRYIAHVGINVIKGKRNGKLAPHPAFNSRQTHINIIFNENDRSLDLPFASNNKSSIDWGSPLGQKYAELINSTFGEDYRKLNYNEQERRDRADIDFYFSTFFGKSNKSEKSFNKCISLEKFGWDTYIDGIYGGIERDANGDVVKYKTKIVDGNLEEINMELNRVDLSKTEIVVEYSGRHKPLSADKVLALMCKVKFIRDTFTHGKTPEGIIYCSSKEGLPFDVEVAKSIYEKEIGEPVRIETWMPDKMREN